VDDAVPSPQKDAKLFFKTFGPAFARNSRWFETQPAPEFGDADTPYEVIAAFYSFWYREKTWREFGYDDVSKRGKSIKVHQQLMLRRCF
jgi:DnaJ family protein C protein 2